MEDTMQNVPFIVVFAPQKLNGDAVCPHQINLVDLKAEWSRLSRPGTLQSKGTSYLTLECAGVSGLQTPLTKLLGAQSPLTTLLTRAFRSSLKK